MRPKPPPDWLGWLSCCRVAKRLKDCCWTQDLRWKLLTRLSGFNHPQVDSLLAKEKQADPSHQGKLAAIGVDAIRPGC